jgi:hypothetical protein
MEMIRWSNKYNPSLEKALAIFLFRMSHPHRLNDMLKLFGCSAGQISNIFNDVAEHLFHTFRDKLFFDGNRLTPQKLQEFRTVIEDQRGGDRVWGWIDGTVTRTARPLQNQKIMFNSHKRQHGFKFQVVVTPDGMVSSLAGPMVGSRNDWYLFVQSGLQDRIIEMYEANDVPEEDWLCIYGDPAYCGSPVTMGAYRRPRQGQLLPTQRLFNYDMSRNRISVEHEFAIIQAKWMKLGFHYAMRTGSSPVAAYFGAAVLLSNLYTCLRGNQISMKYGLQPPTIQEFMR